MLLITSSVSVVQSCSVQTQVCMCVCVWVSGTVFEQWGEGVRMNVYVIAVWVITDCVELTGVKVAAGYRVDSRVNTGKPPISSNSLGAEGHTLNNFSKHRIDRILKHAACSLMLCQCWQPASQHYYCTGRTKKSQHQTYNVKIASIGKIQTQKSGVENTIRKHWAISALFRKWLDYCLIISISWSPLPTLSLSCMVSVLIPFVTLLQSDRLPVSLPYCCLFICLFLKMEGARKRRGHTLRKNDLGKSLIWGERQYQ